MKIQNILAALLVPFGLSIFPYTFAASFNMPANGQDIVGQVFKIIVTSGQDLGDIGRPYGIGGYQMIEANPQFPGSKTTSAGPVTIPQAFILPPREDRKGIVINISELRLYYFKEDGTFLTFPIGIGREGWQTPTAFTSIVEKVVDPIWHVPDGIRAYNAAKGIFLPNAVPPGPDNPLGSFMMRTALGDILIHGTNQPTSVGWRVSSGCIRMLPSDIKSLFGAVTIGTPVRIIDQPYKAGWYNGKLYVEAHLPVQENPARQDTTHHYITTVVNQAIGNHQVTIDWDKVYEVERIKTGIPTAVGQMMEPS